ncbi:hypothetical protein HMPREF3033_00692 [Veillonellaceae bacterium DNF00751]|nr:hypothetical protein HMPREF3033_00692 [Veillonellaceae bacterium DNF00751]
MCIGTGSECGKRTNKNGRIRLIFHSEKAYYIMRNVRIVKEWLHSCYQSRQ